MHESSDRDPPPGPARQPPRGAWIHFMEWIGAREVGAFDRGVLLSMRNPADVSNPIGPGWVEEMGRDFSALGGIAVRYTHLCRTCHTNTGYMEQCGQTRVPSVSRAARRAITFRHGNLRLQRQTAWTTRPHFSPASGMLARADDKPFTWASQ